MYTKQFIVTVIMLLVTACSDKHVNSTEQLISDPVMQDSLFRKLISLTDHSINDERLRDSLVFLILPVQASCPACRDKAIDSIDKHKLSIAQGHFIVISGKGRRTISSYFADRDKELPTTSERIYLDTVDHTFRYDLATTNPVIYYTFNRKVLFKVSCLPGTIKSDLRKFFSKS